MKELPAVNAEIDGDELVYKNHYDIGVAVGTENGLVVPVLRDADQMSFAGVERGIRELGLKARDGKLTMEEMMGRDVHHYQWRHIRFDALDTHSKHAAIRHPGHAQYCGTADGGKRRGRYQAHDVCGA